MATFQTPKGTYDILPDDWRFWRIVTQTVEAVTRRYGYRRIDTPIFEATELFDRGAGSSSDVVTKEMYTFDDKAGRSLTLRPEPTAPVVRAYIQHGMFKLPQPVRLYYVGVPMFRYDDVQEGRQRQFHQFGVEALGEADPSIDAEVISILRDIYRELELSDLTLAINSVGCPDCRPAYVQRLVDYYNEHYDEVCDDDHRRLQVNPLRVLDCKVPRCQPIADAAPHMLDYLCPACRDHWDQVLHLLALEDISYKITHRLVRGLDYYTKTAFEYWPPREGAQSTLGGGGRYDGLAEILGGPPTPGIGFGSGVERVILNLRAQGVQPPAEDGPLAYVAYTDAGVRDPAFRVLARVREAGIGATATATPRKLGDQLRRADGMGARYALIIGPDEQAAGQVSVRALATHDQVSVPIDSVVQWLQEHA